jgi:hypothetical protein
MTVPFELSSKWKRRVYPWRNDGRPIRRDSIEPLSVQNYIAEVAGALRERLAAPESDRRLTTVVEQCDWNTPDSVSLGVLLSCGARNNRAVRLLKWLTQTHGVHAALAAWMESRHIRSWPEYTAYSYNHRSALCYHTEPLGMWANDQTRYLRAQLVCCSDDDYTMALDALSTDRVDATTGAFLAPTSEELIHRALAGGPFTGMAFETLLAAVHTREQLNELVDRTTSYDSWSSGTEHMSGYATAAARVGSAAIAAIGKKLDNGSTVADTAELVELLSMCPSAEAFQALLSRQQCKGARQSLRALTILAPEIGLTELSRSGSNVGRAMMQAYARSHPDIVTELTPALDSDVAKTIEDLAEIHDPLPESAAPPAVLQDQSNLVTQALRSTPGWLMPEMLPQVAMVDGQFGIPRANIVPLITLCRLSAGERPYAGLELVIQQCDPQSLAAWAWALFEQFQLADYPVKDIWALRLQGWVGDDDTVRAISPLIRAWPGESAHQRAALGLDVLSNIGTDLALMHLYRISQKVPFKALRAKAQDKIIEVARELQLTAEELGDRLVPDFGLSAHGTTTIDFGPRQFVAGFDATLRPYLTDADGKPRKSLPKPAATDDSDLAAAETKRFSTLKKDVRGVASDQITRLRRAMRYQRKVDGRDFISHFVTHPLVGILVRRLVWASYRADGSIAVSFRVAEDNTYSDVDDNPHFLDDDAMVGIVHPVQLDPSQLSAWSELFADYELLQPFPQLGRPVFRLVGDEPSGNVLRRFDGLIVPSSALLGMAKQGWERGAPEDAGVQCTVGQLLPSGAEMTIEFRPGIVVGAPEALGDQTIRSVSLSAGSLGDVDAVLMSELLADLADLEGYRK